MTISTEDIKFRKSVVQTDTDTNGGRKGTALVVSGARHALFPRVTKTQRENGIIRYRKEFYCNENADDESAYGVLIYLLRPSTAEDRFYIAKGTQTDTQGQFKRKTDVNTYADTRYARVWTGCGQLQTALSGGESAVAITMENDDFQFPNGGYLHISNNTMTGQTIDSDVRIGDSVYFSSGSWSKISHTDDIAYPNGWCVAADEVITIQDTTNVEFLQIADNHYSGEVIGTGDGSNTSPALSTLTNITNGICRQPNKLPVITAVCGGTERTVNVDADGSCSGYCSAGELNMTTGVWAADIAWTTAPDNGVNIEADYRENAVSYSGNVATVELSDQVASAYTTTTTFCSGCIYEDEVQCSYDSFSVNSSGGTYDDTTNPITLYNDGTVEENWILTFSSASNFSVSGAYYGSIGTGSVGSDFSPTNPDTGQPYMTIASAGWGGSFVEEDTVTFTTSPSAVPVLIEEEVPAGTTQEPNNLLSLGSYTE